MPRILAEVHGRFNPQDFELVSSTSSVYGASYAAPGLSDPLAGVVLAGGQHDEGQLSFQLPTGQTPMQLEYLNQTAKISANTETIPPVSGYVCPVPNVQASVSASSAPGTDAQASLPPTSAYYVSGQPLNVTVTADSITDEPSLDVTTISTNNTALSLTQVLPALPAALASGGMFESVALTLTVATPSAGCVTSLPLQVTISQSAAQASVTGVSFPANGAYGQITLLNAGNAPTSVLGTLSLTYGGVTCRGAEGGSGIPLNPGVVTNFDWTYSGGDPCTGEPATPGEQFTGTLSLDDPASIGEQSSGTANPQQVTFEGTFQQPAQTSGAAQVSVTGLEFPAADFTSAGNSTTYVCATIQGTFTAFGGLILSNTGAAGATITSVTITWAGASNAFTSASACSIGATGSATSTVWVFFSATSKLSVNAVAGQTFSGVVTLSDSAQVVFTGTFQ